MIYLYFLLIIILIMRIQFTYISIILLLCAQVNSYNINSLRSQKETIFPFLVEYIDEFSISSNDVQKILENQFKQITIGSIDTSAFSVFNNTISLSYKGGSKIIEQLNPLKVKVTNDSFQLIDQFSIKVIHIRKSIIYTCQVKVPQIFISYVKQVDFSSGNTLIKELKSSYSSKSFQQPTCKQTIAANDKTPIAEAVNSTTATSIFLELKKTFDRIQEYLSYNAKDERLSKIYNDNPYSYDYYGFKIDINVSTLHANDFKENGIENQILGTISETSATAIQPPEYEQGYNTFISLQFIKNMLEFTKKNYGSWQAVKLTRSNIRTNFFKFRLIDFEQIIPNLLKQYPNKYMSDVEIQCAAQTLGDTTLDEKYITQRINWKCLGSFQTDDNKKLVFLNFLVGIKHVTQLFVQQNYMEVRVDQVSLVGLNFDYIGTYEVVDPFTLSQYIKQGLFEFKIYTIGTYFKVNSPNKIKKQIPQRGIWVG